MIKRKLLGQHFLNSKSIAEFIVKEAEISKNDIVFEIGTGPGILTPLLCENAQKVISVDADEKLIKKAKLNFSQFDNLILKSGDGFNQKDVFSLVSLGKKEAVYIYSGTKNKVPTNLLF